MDDQLLGIVRDPQVESTLRRDAAITLLDRGTPATIQAMLEDLKVGTEATCRRPIIQALRSCRQPPAESGPIVLAIAGELDPLLYEEAGEALGRSSKAADVRSLQQMAQDSQAKAGTRQIAIIALGHIRTQDAAKALIAVLQNVNEEAKRNAAGAALGRLSGIEGNGTDAARWQAWWEQVKSMNAQQWQAHLLANFTRRTENLARQRSVLQDRLMTALRQRYRAVAQEEREAVLIGMLADPLDSVRELALDLVRELVNTEQVGQGLAKALLTRLNDTSPIVRTGAALVLRDLKNDEAADVVARRLAEEMETDKAVLKAYLLLMRRQPKLAAMGPAIALLSDVDVRAEAAGALLAGFDNKPSLIGAEQTQRIAIFLRSALKSETIPEPRFIELLARAGNRDDFRSIRSWLDHSSDAVREAAARAWVASGQSLEPLAQRAGDPIIQIIVIPAATERGSSRETMLALVMHRPENEQIAAAWGRALVAMAPRVNPDAVVRADQKLVAYGDLTDLRLQVLSPAIDKLLGRVSAVDLNGFGVAERQIYTLQLVDLLLARSEARLISGDSKAALADLERVTALKIDLSQQQQQRFTLTTIHALIVGGELDGAFTKAGKYLSIELPSEEEEALRSQIIELLLITADQCLTAKQHERASQIVSRLRARLPRPVDLKVEMRTAILEQRIKMALETPPTPPTPPAPPTPVSTPPTP